MTSSKPGFSLLELVFVVAIVGLLIALLLPAVVAARGSARNSSCQNNVRQIALAVSNYHSTHRMLPPRRYAFKDLLTNFEENIDRMTTPYFYACPSDDLLDASIGEVSYRFNEGYAFQLYGSNGVVSHPYKDDRVRFGDITDGLSNTALLSEKLVLRWSESSDEAKRRPLRYSFQRALREVPASLIDFETLVQQCLTPDDSGFPNFNWGHNTNLRQEFGYNHNLPPGSISWHFPITTSGAIFDPRNSFVSSTSDHFGAVNVAYVDCSVHTVTNRVDNRIWGNIGTRNGNESNHDLD